MRVVINAIPIQPGGGLTVVRGILSSLHAVQPRWHLSVLTGSSATHQTLLADGCADYVEQMALARNSLASLLWQNTRLDRKLSDLHCDVLLTINHHLMNLSVPQVVYHLNLRRFCKSYRSSRPQDVVQEFLRDWMSRQALKQAAANVFESRFLLEAAQSATGQAITNPHVAYIGLPEDLHAMPRKDGAQGTTSRRIVTVTSAEPHKDNITLLKMVAELCQRRPEDDWRLEIAGGIDPQVWLPIRRLAEQLGIRERVTWHGFCNGEKLTELMGQSLCVVLTSQLESFAMVALESMARGCPVIVANCTAMPESVGNGGLVATAGNPASFARAVLGLADDIVRRAEMIDKGYAWIKPFRWEECGHRFSRIIGEISGRRDKPPTTRTGLRAA